MQQNTTFGDRDPQLWEIARSTLGWGTGLVFHFFDAYIYPEANSAEQEYERLKRKQPK
jgi:hypothetical protein